MDAGSIPATSTKMMKNILKLITITIALTCMPTAGVTPEATASDYRSNYESLPAMNTKPLQVGKWHTIPKIVVCHTAPIEELSVKSAVVFWTRLGYKFRTTLYKKDTAACSDDTPNGYIVIHLVSKELREKMDTNILAETHFYVDRYTKEIGWAKIYLVTKPPKLVLEHEIGHALGFLHYNKNGHLMHEKLIYSGWDTEGVVR